MTGTPEFKLDAYGWLPIGRWSVDTVMNIGDLAGKKYCKICDEWISLGKTERHVKSHIREYQKLVQQRKDEAAAERARERELAAQERALEKEFTASLYYSEPCRICKKSIPRTGRRGRPPLTHDECK